MNKINVVCLKWGDKYDAEYVNRLYSMVKRNLTIPFDFYCITEDSHNIDKAIRIKTIPDIDLTGWWFKLTLFKKDAYDFKGKVLFLDLDMVIIANIDELCQQDSGFVAFKDHIYDEPGTAVLFFDINNCKYIWDEFIKDYKNITQRLSGDQDWVGEIIDRSKVHFLPQEWFVSYKNDCKSKGVKLFGDLGKLLGLWFAFGEATVPKEAKIVNFHGKPYQKDVIEKSYLFWKKAPFVKQHWR